MDIITTFQINKGVIHLGDIDDTYGTSLCAVVKEKDRVKAVDAEITCKGCLRTLKNYRKYGSGKDYLAWVARKRA